MLPSSSLGDQDIGRFDVAVNEPLLVRCVECLGDLRKEVDGTLGVEGSVLGYATDSASS